MDNGKVAMPGTARAGGVWLRYLVVILIVIKQLGDFKHISHFSDLLGVHSAKEEAGKCLQLNAPNAEQNKKRWGWSPKQTGEILAQF